MLLQRLFVKEECGVVVKSAVNCDEQWGPQKKKQPRFCYVFHENPASAETAAADISFQRVDRAKSGDHPL